MTSDEFRAKLKLEWDLVSMARGESPTHICVGERAYKLLCGNRSYCDDFMGAPLFRGSATGAVWGEMHMELWCHNYVKAISWTVIAQPPVE